MKNKTSRFSAGRLGFGLLAGLVPAAAVAQTSEPVTEISFDLGARYDSNISRANELRVDRRGLEKSDVAISPTLSLNIERPIGPNSVFLRGSVGYVFHARNSVLDRERLRLDGGADVAIGPCRVRPEASLFRGQSDLADLVVDNGAFVDDARNTETVQRYASEVACGAEYGLQPFASVAHEIARNSSDLRNRAEYDEWSYAGGLGYNSPALGRIRLYASQVDNDLVGQTLLTGRDGYTINAIGVDYARAIGTRLTFNGNVGYSKLRPRNGLTDSFSGLTWSASATVLVTDRLQVQAQVGRELANSLASDSAYMVSQPYGLRVRYAANERLQFDAGASITRRRYEFATLPAVDFITRETRRIYDANASYRVGERLRLRVGVGREERNANGAIFDYSSTFATAGIGLVF